MKLFLILLVFAAPSCYRPEVTVQALQRPQYEYHFTVDGTDNTLLYTIYTSDSVILATDILASQIDSVIIADNQ
jgi:hypothetical protein